MYSVAGTAALGVDYTLDGNPGEVVIPAGQGSVEVHMHALPSVHVPKGKTVKLKLTSNAAYKTPRRAGKVATIKIVSPSG